MAQQNDNLELLLEVLKLEKRVFAQGIGGENHEAVNTIIRQVQEVNTKINNINVLSNIQVRLNNWYAKTGFVRKAQYNKKSRITSGKIYPLLTKTHFRFRKRSACTTYT